GDALGDEVFDVAVDGALGGLQLAGQRVGGDGRALAAHDLDDLKESVGSAHAADSRVSAGGAYIKRAGSTADPRSRDTPMVTLFGGGPRFGLPELGLFVTKTE